MTSKKKILFFGIKTFPSKGGTDRVAENLIRNLQADFDITLFCFDEDLPEESAENIRIIRFRQLFPGSTGSLIYFLQSSMRALFMDFDLIHVHKTDCAFFIPLLRIRHKVIATSHEAPYLRDKWNGMQKTYFRLAERLFIRTPNRATCISEPLTRYYQDRYDSEVSYIPNGIRLMPVEHYNMTAAQKTLPDTTDLEKPFILFAARRLMSTKGCHTLLQALHKINYTGRIFIAGESNHHGEYISRLDKLAQGLDVRFLGFVHPLKTMLALISKSQLFVFPSETEGMSIMLLEAASTGTPVIASDIPENRILSDQELLFFKSQDPDNLAEKISFALESPEQMKAMGQRARHAVGNRYDWSWIAQTYRNLYLDLLTETKVMDVDLRSNTP